MQPDQSIGALKQQAVHGIGLRESGERLVQRWMPVGGAEGIAQSLQSRDGQQSSGDRSRSWRGPTYSRHDNTAAGAELHEPPMAGGHAGFPSAAPLGLGPLTMASTLFFKGSFVVTGKLTQDDPSVPPAT